MVDQTCFVKGGMRECLPTGGQVWTSRSDGSKEPSKSGCEKPWGHSETGSSVGFGALGLIIKLLPAHVSPCRVRGLGTSGRERIGLDTDALECKPARILLPDSA